MASCVRLNVKKMAKHIIGVGKLTKHGTTVLLVIFYLPTFFPTDFFISRSEIPGKFRIVFQGRVLLLRFLFLHLKILTFVSLYMIKVENSRKNWKNKFSKYRLNLLFNTGSLIEILIKIYQVGPKLNRSYFSARPYWIKVKLD